MQFHKKITISSVSSLLILSLTHFFAFIPCKIIPAPINAEPFWNYCYLNNQNAKIFQTSKIIYFGQSPNTILTNLILFGLVFILTFIVLTYLFKSNNR